MAAKKATKTTHSKKVSKTKPVKVTKRAKVVKREYGEDVLKDAYRRFSDDQEHIYPPFGELGTADLDLLRQAAQAVADGAEPISDFQKAVRAVLDGE